MEVLGPLGPSALAAVEHFIQLCAAATVTSLALRADRSCNSYRLQYIPRLPKPCSAVAHFRLHSPAGAAADSVSPVGYLLLFLILCHVGNCVLFDEKKTAASRNCGGMHASGERGRLHAYPAPLSAMAQHLPPPPHGGSALLRSCPGRPFVGSHTGSSCRPARPLRRRKMR